MCSPGVMSEIDDSWMAGVDGVPEGLQLQKANMPEYSLSGVPVLRKVISGASPWLFREWPGTEYARCSGKMASSVGMFAGAMRSGCTSQSLWNSLCMIAVSSVSFPEDISEMVMY